jgi:hypothetical protein
MHADTLPVPLAPALAASVPLKPRLCPRRCRRLFRRWRAAAAAAAARWAAINAEMQDLCWAEFGGPRHHSFLAFYQRYRAQNAANHWVQKFWRANDDGSWMPPLHPPPAIDCLVLPPPAL